MHEGQVYFRQELENKECGCRQRQAGTSGEDELAQIAADLPR